MNTNTYYRKNKNMKKETETETVTKTKTKEYKNLKTYTDFSKARRSQITTSPAHCAQRKHFRVVSVGRGSILIKPGTRASTIGFREDFGEDTFAGFDCDVGV
jgi:uncharacterized membrane-anchored protein